MTLIPSIKSRSLSATFLADLMTRINNLEEAVREKGAQFRAASVVTSDQYMHVYDKDTGTWLIFDVDAETVVDEYQWVAMPAEYGTQWLIGRGPNDNIWTWGQQVVAGSPETLVVRLHQYHRDTGAHVGTVVCDGVDRITSSHGDDGWIAGVGVGGVGSSYIFPVQMAYTSDGFSITYWDVTYRFALNGTFEDTIKTKFISSSSGGSEQSTDGLVMGDSRDSTERYWRSAVRKIDPRFESYNDDGSFAQALNNLFYEILSPPWRGGFEHSWSHRIDQSKGAWVHSAGRTVSLLDAIISDISLSNSNFALWPLDAKDELYTVPDNPTGINYPDIDIYTVTTGAFKRKISAYKWMPYEMTQWFRYKWDVTTNIVTDATNASPIVVTAPGHNRTTGDSLTLQGIRGNTAANGTWTITVIDPDTYSLDGSVGNGDYTFSGVWTLGDSHELVGVKPTADDFDNFSDFTPYRLHAGTIRDMLNAVERICPHYKNSATGNPWEPPGSTPPNTGDQIYREKVDDQWGDWLADNLGNIDSYNRMQGHPWRIFAELEAIIVALEASDLVNPLGS